MQTASQLMYRGAGFTVFEMTQDSQGYALSSGSPYAKVHGKLFPGQRDDSSPEHAIG